MEAVPSCSNRSLTGAPTVARRQWDAPLPLRIWHVASMDAPTVAVVWSLGFAWAAGIDLPRWAPILLALTAWAVYIGDRLLDAHAGMQSPPLHALRDRHTFHWRHRCILGSLALVASGASLWIVITRVPAPARGPDSAIAAATLVYFSGVHSRFKLPRPLDRLLSHLCSRTFLIGALFTAGCLLPAWSQLRATAGHDSNVRLLVAPALFFSALGWLNCHAIGQWESPRLDRLEPLHGTAGLVALFGFLLAVFIAFAEPRPAMLIALGSASALLLALLDRMRSRLTPLALRAAADLVLLTPALLIGVEFVSK